MDKIPLKSGFQHSKHLADVKKHVKVANRLRLNDITSTVTISVKFWPLNLGCQIARPGSADRI